MGKIHCNYNIEHPSKSAFFRKQIVIQASCILDVYADISQLNLTKNIYVNK